MDFELDIRRRVVLQIIGMPEGPTPELSVLRALCGIDSDLRVAWSKYWLNFLAKPPAPLLDQHGKPMEYPRWYVFIQRGQDFHFLFKVESDQGEYRSLDMRVPKKILSDLGRHYSPDIINRMVREGQAKFEQAREDKLADLRQMELVANKRKIQEAIEEPGNLDMPAEASMQRDQKIIVYPGKTDFSSHHENITRTPEELDWELVDYAKEME